MNGVMKLQMYVEFQVDRLRYFTRKRKEAVRVYIRKHGEQGLYGALMVALICLIVIPL